MIGQMKGSTYKGVFIEYDMIGEMKGSFYKGVCIEYDLVGEVSNLERGMQLMDGGFPLEG